MTQNEPSLLKTKSKSDCATTDATEDDNKSNNIISAEDHTILFHIVNTPSALNSFLHTLKTTLNVDILECQTSGPSFLDIYARSTLQAKQPPLPSSRDITLKKVDASSSSSHNFSKERQALHARIATQLYFDPHVPTDLLKPKFILLLGIPGAGKTSMLTHLDASERIVLQDFVNFDIDDIIALLPEFYQAMLNIGLGNFSQITTSSCGKHDLEEAHARYNQCQDEAKFILNTNLEVAMERHMNIILHGSGRSVEKYLALFKQLQSRERCRYETHLMCVDVPLPTALHRVDTRSKGGFGRHVPHAFVEVAHDRVVPHFRRLMPLVPHAHLFDGTESPPRLIWSKQSHEVVHQDKSHAVHVKFQL